MILFFSALLYTVHTTYSDKGIKNQCLALWWWLSWNPNRTQLWQPFKLSMCGFTTLLLSVLFCTSDPGFLGFCTLVSMLRWIRGQSIQVSGTMPPRKKRTFYPGQVKGEGGVTPVAVEAEINMENSILWRHPGDQDIGEAWFICVGGRRAWIVLATWVNESFLYSPEICQIDSNWSCCKAVERLQNIKEVLGARLPQRLRLLWFKHFFQSMQIQKWIK